MGSFDTLLGLLSEVNDPRRAEGKLYQPNFLNWRREPAIFGVLGLKAQVVSRGAAPKLAVV